MFALKLSFVIWYENIEFASLCFNEGADDVEESGCWFFIPNSCAEPPPVLLFMNFRVSYLFVTTT